MWATYLADGFFGAPAERALGGVRVDLVGVRIDFDCLTAGRAEVLLEDAFVLASECFWAVAALVGAALLFFAAMRELLLTDAADVDFDLVALRTGAFSALERLANGFGREAFVFSLRLFAVNADEALRVGGREEVLFTPLMIGSLMHSTRLSKWLQREEPAKRPQDSIAFRINQHITGLCGCMWMSRRTLRRHATKKNY